MRAKRIMRTLPEDTYDLDPIINLTNLAQLLGLPRASIYEVIERYRVPTIILGKQRGVRRSVAKALMDRLPVIDRAGVAADA